MVIWNFWSMWLLSNRIPEVFIFLVCSIRTAWSVGPYSYNIYVGISDSSWQQAEIILEIISNIRDHIYRHFTPLLIFLEILRLILPANFFPLNLRIWFIFQGLNFYLSVQISVKNRFHHSQQYKRSNLKIENTNQVMLTCNIFVFKKKMQYMDILHEMISIYPRCSIPTIDK